LQLKKICLSWGLHENYLRKKEGVILRILKSKKGDIVGDSILAMIVLFALVYGIILVYPILTDVNTDVQADTDFSTESKASIQDLTNRTPAWGDGLFVFVFAFMFFTVIFTSYFINSSPAFFVIALIIFIVLMGIGMLLSNAHEEFMEDSDLSTLTTTFPKTHWLMSNIVGVILGMMVVMGIVIYGKVRNN